MTVAHAYARVVSNLDDEKKKDVLVLLLENPLPRSALGAIEDDEADGTAILFRQMLMNRNVRGLALRLATDRNAATEAPDQIRALFNGEDYDFGNLQLELKSFAADSIEGQIKSNVRSQPG